MSYALRNFAEYVPAAAPPASSALKRNAMLDGLSASGPFFANPLAEFLFVLLIMKEFAEVL